MARTCWSEAVQINFRNLVGLLEEYIILFSFLEVSVIKFSFSF